MDESKKEKRKLTQERVKELFDYNPETGEITWKVSTNPRAPVGGIAGYIAGRGYRIIGVDNQRYSAHRLIWLWMENHFPEYEIDHISGVRDDNRWCNLRHVTASCNRFNRERTRCIGGEVIGVRGRNNRFESYITVSEKTTYLGLFSTLVEAVCHRYAAEQCLEIDNMISERGSSAYQYLKQQGIIK